MSEAKKNGQRNFYECCDLMKKVLSNWLSLLGVIPILHAPEGGRG